MLTFAFWSDTLQRSLRTFAQTLLAGFGGNALNIWSANWHQMIGLALGSSLISVCMSIDRSGTSAPTQTTVVVDPVIKVGDQPSAGACGNTLR